MPHHFHLTITCGWHPVCPEREEVFRGSLVATLAVRLALTGLRAHHSPAYQALGAFVSVPLSCAPRWTAAWSGRRDRGGALAIRSQSGGGEEQGEEKKAFGFWDALKGPTRTFENRRYVTPYEKRDLMGGMLTVLGFQTETPSLHT